MNDPLRYSIRRADGQVQTAAPAAAALSAEAIDLSAPGAPPWRISWREVAAVSSGDYRIGLRLEGGESVELDQLGYRYEDFLRQLTGFRNQMLLDDLLMGEKLVRGGFRADHRLRAEDGRVIASGPAEVRIYETGLVAMPDNGELTRLPAGRLLAVEAGEYQLTLIRDDGQRLDLARMGTQHGPFGRELDAWLNALDTRLQERIRDWLPEAGAPIRRLLAAAMREGRGVGRREVEAIHPPAWPVLHNLAAEGPLADDFAFLRREALPEGMVLGVKRGLFGALSGDTLWLLLPLAGGLTAWLAARLEEGKEGAAPAGTGEGDDHATYLFRAPPESLPRLAASLLDVNFRREPIYLSDQALDQPRNLRYRTAVRRLPALAELRRLYAGRVLHRSAAEWQSGMKTLMDEAKRVSGR